MTEDIVNDIFVNPDITATEIASKYKITHTYSGKDGKIKRGAYTIPITMLIKGIKLLKEKAKIIGINERFSP